MSYKDEMQWCDLKKQRSETGLELDRLDRTVCGISGRILDNK